MAEEQKETHGGFQSCCGGMPFEDMVRKMMEAKKSGFNCAEMMSHVMHMCCGAGKKREESTPETQDNPVPHH